MIRVLIVDDSRVACAALRELLRQDPGIAILGEAHNGAEALSMIAREKPDLVTMDINMPGMNGLEATRRIMETCPVPILIISAGVTSCEATTVFEALKAGALGVLPKPGSQLGSEWQSEALAIIETVHLLAGVCVHRRTPESIRLPSSAKDPGVPDVPQVVVMGASTGGPVALNELLSCLPQDFPLPIALVQHIAAGFGKHFASWLSESSKHPVTLAAQGERLLPGHVYLAPDGQHLELSGGPCSQLSSDPPDQGLRPSVKRLFRSAALHFGNRAIAVLLTGMGRDGAEEMKHLRDLGALTIAQDQKSSLIHGMPGEAIRLGAAVCVLPPQLIAYQLVLASTVPPINTP